MLPKWNLLLPITVEENNLQCCLHFSTPSFKSSHPKHWLLPPQPLTPSTPNFDSSHSSQPTLGFLVERNVFLISICHWISLRWIYLIPSKAMNDSQAPKLHGLCTVECTVCEPVSTRLVFCILCFLHKSIKMITDKREKLLRPEAQEWILASTHADSIPAPVSETTSSGFWPLAFSTAELYGELELV